MSLLKGYYLKKAFDTLEYTASELEQHKLRLLNDLVATSREVPFYRENGVDTTPLANCGEISRFPVLRRKDIEAGERFRHSDVPASKQYRTTGTTGPRLEIVFDPQAYDWRSAVHIRSMLLLGYRPFHPIAKYWEDDFERSWIGRMVMPYRPVYKEDPFYYQLKMLETHDSCFIAYYPQVLFTLAKYKRFAEQAFDISPEIVFVHGELLTPSMRSFIEETFDTTVKELYMTSELGVAAWECPDGGYHIVEDTVYAEVIDEDGDSADPGEEGELVVTNMTNHATQLVRHATGDIVVRSEASCGCDTVFGKLERIRGRKHNVVETAERTIFPDQIVDLLASFPEMLVFQFVIREDGYRVRYVPSPGQTVPVEEIQDRFDADLGLSVSLEEADELSVGESSKLPIFVHE